MHRTIKHIFLIFFLTIGVLLPEGAVSQFLGYKLMYSRKKAHIPFELYSNLVVIPVKLNGVVPLKFVVDTGVRSTIITEKLITDILKLPYSRKITVNGPGENIILVAYVVNSVDIVLEGAIGSEQSILVLEEDYLKLRNYLGLEVHGLIGFDLFNRFIVGFDYMRMVMTLYEPDKFKPPRNYAEVPMAVEDTKPYIFVKLQMNDTTMLYAKLMVDSGASHAIMLNADSHENITVPPLYIQTQIGRGLGGPISGKISVIKGLEFGRFEFSNVVVSFPEPEFYPDSIGLVYRNGTIGGELLSRFKVIFDYFNKKIYFKKNSAYKKEFGYNMSGITVIAEGEELTNIKITDIRKGSAAEKADIRVDDFIINLNGVDADKLTLGDMYRLFNFRNRKKIRLIIERNGVLIQKVFRLEDHLVSY
jgi:hypothetical protein